MLAPVHYLEFLDGVHRRLRPDTYLEIGVRHGRSLALARCRSVGIDPAYRLRVPLAPDTTLFRERSDEYFARPDPREPFDGRWISLAFIDGMHLVEYALRDFINVERHTHWTSVVAFDDVLPRNETEARRDRRTDAWTGDVYAGPGHGARAPRCPRPRSWCCPPRSGRRCARAETVHPTAAWSRCARPSNATSVRCMPDSNRRPPETVRLRLTMKS